MNLISCALTVLRLDPHASLAWLRSALRLLMLTFRTLRLLRHLAVRELALVNAS
jgi:hypothetical protein